ncbi:extracellular solute-binding protein [Glycomyces sp. TRM65418]|uniref:ABC transporter substrate-binding protein n=1 Tax=Glycomyces sp. TRM65418 TaxID=2867006 RepID=UPI001CE70F6B|nr:extracellular solute-binding protein [Glycomyces sp. TRM65418]MCC3765907.1 extracellular solute-binding protein [Glycomyces sp. TRM65418]QZD55489.1 extracellular solute-binding protein [Glycomyces sp. TRM65418]
MKLGTSRRSLLALGAAAPVVATLGACGNRPGSSSADGATAWGLTGGAEEAMRASFEDWNEAHPDDQITAEYFANDAYKEKIRTAIGSGNAPTLVFGWAGATLADYVANDQVIDLTEPTSALTDRVLPSVVQVGMIDGSVYAVPNNQSQPVVMYHNNEVLEAAGTGVPETWSDLLAAVEALKAHDVVPIALAGQSVWPELMWISYLADRVGGEAAFQRVLDGEAGAWSHPDMLRAAQMITELVDAGAFGDGFASVVADAGADHALVSTGKAGMILQGSWIYPEFLTNAPDLVASGGLIFSTFPIVEGGAGDPSNIVGNPANYWSVASSAPEDAQQTATDYLSEAVYNDEHIDALLAIGAVPPVVGLEDRIAEEENNEFLEFTYAMVRDAAHFELSWDQALPADQAQELLNNLSRLFLGDITAEQFAEAMDATL